MFTAAIKHFMIIMHVYAVQNNPADSEYELQRLINMQIDVSNILEANCLDRSSVIVSKD